MLGTSDSLCKRKIRNYTKKKTTCYIERDEQERTEFIEKISNLLEETEIFYADESGFEEDYSACFNKQHSS